MLGWVYLNTGVRVGIPVTIMGMECDPLLGHDFINHYNATLRLRKLHSTVIVRQPTAPFITPALVPDFVVRVAGRRFIAVVDTGCTNTYLSRGTACVLQIHMVPLAKPRKILTPDGYDLAELVVSRMGLRVNY